MFYCNMALNKFMHPRNIYKNPPDFGLLAKKFEEFSNVAQKDVTGKVTIDFKDPNALRVLTASLLKSDFNLNVVIPENRLVPTLPLRLNYILWIEDLLNVFDISESICGIDIGTGACAIYPLLAAVKNKWHMIGTETDDESVTYATENIKNNNLQNFIEVRKNSTKTMIEHLFNDENSRVYHFTMCNPPFYTNIEELCESRSPARPPPRNGFTGSPQELITEGGELQFCRQMINESKSLKNNILIFTSMVGHKYNLKELVIDLKAEHIKHTTTEFCQGRVTRWGLAWTFQDYDMSKIEPTQDKLRKKNTPITLKLPELKNEDTTLNIVVDKIKNMLQDLKIVHKKISKRNNEILLDIVAFTNNWSNQRRKRRLLKQIAESEAKVAKINAEDESSNKMNMSINLKGTSSTDANEKDIQISHDKEKLENGVSVNPEKQTSAATTSTSNESPLVHAVMKLCIKNNSTTIEMEYIEGIAGKEGLHQIIQYIKNNWK